MSVWTNVVVWLYQIVNNQIHSEAQARLKVGQDSVQLEFLCPYSSSSCPEHQALHSSKEGGPFYPSKEETEEEAVPGYYTTNSYQYQDTEL